MFYNTYDKNAYKLSSTGKYEGILFDLTVSLAATKIEHTREVYNLMDLIGELGGVLEILIVLCSYFVCPISEHTFVLKALESLYLGRTFDKNLFVKSNLKTKKHKNKFKSYKV